MSKRDRTRERIRQVMVDRPGIRQWEIAKLLGISDRTVWAAVRDIRAEWQAGDAK